MSEARVAFFGGEPLGVPALQALINAGYTPSLVVCNPDRPAGRGKQTAAPPVKVLAEAHNIPVWQPETIPSAVPTELDGVWDVFVVAAYNQILPPWLLDLPTHHTINLHPSLLPKLRGASPIRSAILHDCPEHVGVSIMQLETAMDSGPLLAQERLDIAPADWPPRGPDLDARLAEHGAELLVQTLPRWLRGDITTQPQRHEDATYCGRLHKQMAELALDPHNLPTGPVARDMYLTIQAFAGIGDAWFVHSGVRYKITAAHLEGEQLIIDTIVPAGKSETSWNQCFPAAQL